MQLKWKGEIEPQQKSLGAACWDIALPADTDVFKGFNVISLGIAFEIPPKHYLRLDPRSSTFAKHNLLSPSSIIDEDYRGEVHGFIYNPGETIQYTKGVRLFQITLCQQIHCMLAQVDELADSVRGTGGMGSTGE